MREDLVFSFSITSLVAEIFKCFYFANYKMMTS